MKKVNSILIANRGEISSRIIRTCKKMGIRSIAVFSEADRNALFVEEADVAIFIGESLPNLSYLNQDKIIDVAKKNNADAIHPGYGFLSENVIFAKRCADENIIFIGPNIDAIESMGSKSRAKKLMTESNVPVVPGYQGEDQSMEKLSAEAEKIGFPILLKATAGGGGKGMRIVHSENKISESIEAAKRESKSAFGDDELIIEKYIESGRHIEFQIFGDQHGNVIHLLERECTIQRRYQKVIEESPSPIMDNELRNRMGTIAVQAAKALQYDNAGTVEFIFDEKTRDFYFLEVNTRLQVEHPVTEMITGLDLVEMQIESAQGMPLKISQHEVIRNGYAVEARLYAEDASNNFLPVTGNIQRFEIPRVEGLRVEKAIQSGSNISVFYDPMIAKLIVWDKSRNAAHRKMKYVLRNLICLGMKTNQDFLLHLFENEDFGKGIYDTHFIKNKIDVSKLNEVDDSKFFYSTIAATLYEWKKRENNRTILKKIPSGWRNSFYEPQKECFFYGKNELEIAYRFLNGIFIFSVGEKKHNVKLIFADDKKVIVEIEATRHQFHIAQSRNEFFIQNENFGNIHINQKERFPKKEIKKIKGGFAAPMPAQVIKVLVEKGQRIKSGDGLIVLSSMKMENTIYAESDGIVEAIFAKEGSNVEAGFLLLKMNSNNLEENQ